MCGATPSWVKHANTGTPLPLTSYVAEVMAVNSSASIFTLLINGSTIDTMASYVMRLWMVWNGNRNALVPINSRLIMHCYCINFHDEMFAKIYVIMMYSLYVCSLTRTESGTFRRF